MTDASSSCWPLAFNTEPTPAYEDTYVVYEPPITPKGCRGVLLGSVSTVFLLYSSDYAYRPCLPALKCGSFSMTTTPATTASIAEPPAFSTAWPASSDLCSPDMADSSQAYRYNTAVNKHDSYLWSFDLYGKDQDQPALELVQGTTLKA